MASKPGLLQSQSAPPVDAGNGEAGAWSPQHALAPGLHLVATPIGNLGDVTLRGLWVLRHCDRILCEDTRVTARLLARHGVEKPLAPYHDHNADRVRAGILDALGRGEKLALVSDAGTPLVSDPGYKLVREALAAGLPVTAAPGPSAALTALILSGLPPDRFLFAGFLPARSGERRRALERLRIEDRTIILYEAPHRIEDTVSDAREILGDRPACLAREVTKLHEEFRRGTLGEISVSLTERPARGEITLLIGPVSAEDKAAHRDTSQSLAERVDELIRQAKLDRKEALKLAAKERGITKRAAYHELHLDLREPEA